MAESVSDQNVEDMLSSVRRLVSSELPRNRKPRLSDGASALVLTEAQRVQPGPAVQTPKGMTLEQRIAELEAAVDGQSNDWEPDGSEDQEEHRPRSIVYRPSRPRDEAPEESRRTLRLSEIAMIDTGPADRVADEEAEEHEFGDNIAASSEVTFRHEAETEKSVVSASDEEAPDDDGSPSDTAPPAQNERSTSAPADFAGDPFADAIARDVAAVVAEMASTGITENDFAAKLAETVRDPAETRGVSRARPVSPSDADATSQPEAPPSREVGQTLAEADQEIAVPIGTEPESGPAVEVTAAAVSEDATGQDTEPLVAPADGAPMSEPAPDGLDAVPARPRSEQSPEGVSREERAMQLDEAEAPTQNLLALSPDQLRLLVSSMIRQELKGELGERITRNVRKMVRQEVHRALSVRDLE